ncbi:FAD-dependent oxidoreductase [Pacificibacter marinus]|uniref:3-(3-hydroxy-phenyl)propionate/3-hydroxycinnamic acid hydroxylase n=1 Tax=Pacificibacter marinus TaxID=658057 RepID=A0A1Y5TIC3_9RHOB|nr:FAD-dependent oxidoreductase [Pacificibacter marinus]SEL26452.1 3-(3-hydroxy-phenyl)propionate hydroxylase [Pacificibacter marinus]SLN64370.1 3-(3-hydroxy-phenyl)propionate/3-hydroxycinnamic acid hydroxylase [Pacificibacter marinus]
MVDIRYDLAFTLYPYEKVAAQDHPPARHPVVVIGGGPVGMALAVDLGQRGTPVLLLDDHEGVGQGSRAICFSKRTLEICDRLGFGQAVHDKGVIWNVGRVFHGETPVFNFDLQPEDGDKFPAFVNLQQPYFEKFATKAARTAQNQGAPIEIRGRNRVTQIDQHDTYAVLTVETPDGSYQIEADWVIACDGARSPSRKMLGLEFKGRVFEDNFLIADVKMTADFPSERWFWFEPPFEGAGQSALLHKQPDDIWRIDFQLGWDIDRDAELDPANIRRRVDAMLSSQTGTVPAYDLEWISIYTFQCRRMEKFVHNRVIFAGDAAHQVSPFGARGANSGLQDIDNLAWKLELVVKGLAGDALIESYDMERSHGADENILNSSRATDFMTPKSAISKVFRNAVLTLAQKHDFARPLVNSGRLSVPCIYDDLPLNGPDMMTGPARTRVGASCPDAPFGDGFLLENIGGKFTLLVLNTQAPQDLCEAGIEIETLITHTPSAELRTRYLGQHDAAVYLIRPDQHIVARWPTFDETALRAALRTAIAKDRV